MTKEIFGEKLVGRFCTLVPLDAQSMVGDLYAAAKSDERIWQYMPYGPFSNQAGMYELLSGLMNSSSDFLYGVKHHELNRFVGVCGYLANVPEYRRIEIGHVWYGKEVQKSKINTEATYLLLQNIFKNSNYRRVEWKCHSENQGSERTALRMGFVFEGIFRQHMWVKNANRDTKYFSMIDSEWPMNCLLFEKYLYQNAQSLTALRADRNREP